MLLFILIIHDYSTQKQHKRQIFENIYFWQKHNTACTNMRYYVYILQFVLFVCKVFGEVTDAFAGRRQDFCNTAS